jgi:hypothetical protein
MEANATHMRLPNVRMQINAKKILLQVAWADDGHGAAAAAAAAEASRPNGGVAVGSEDADLQRAIEASLREAAQVSLGRSKRKYRYACVDASCFVCA